MTYPVGREPIQLVEIRQPLCANTFGVSPCTATGTADTKCYNTRATCQDTANYTLGTPLSLWFCNGQALPSLDATVRPRDSAWASGFWDDSSVWDDAGVWTDADTGINWPSQNAVSATYPAYIFPALVSVSTSPTRVNLAVTSRDSGGLGNRALCTIRLRDFQHTDRLVDPYVDGRSWNPLDASRGSFWARWLVRNKYRTNIEIVVYEGYVGQALSAMRKRLYFLHSVTKQNSAGEITIEAKDVLARLEERQAQAPIASAGVLYTDIGAGSTSFEVAGAVEADYPASGTLRINDELMTYTARATSTNGIEFTGVTRGTDGTTASDHSADDTVQTCIRYASAPLLDVLIDQLQTRGGVPSDYMAGFLSGGQAYEEIANYLTFVQIDRVLSVPRSIGQNIAELAEQIQFYIWWEETEQRIKFKAIRGYDEPPDTLTEDGHIISGTFSMRDKPKERASQVWVYYAQRNATGSDTDAANYRKQYVVANLESETNDLHGTPSIRKITSAWVSQDAIAQTTATKISNKYVDMPTEAKLRVDIKDGAYQIGDVFYVSHHLDVDQYGNRRLRPWAVISREEVVPNEIVEYVLDDISLYDQVYFIMASGSADYDLNNKPFYSAYIGDANGLLSDDTNCARIA